MDNKGEFNLQLQQWNSFSLQKERDVYSYEDTPQKISLLLGAKPGSGTIADAGKGDCAPTELRSKEMTAKL